MFRKRGFLASDWCDPILATSDQTLVWLAEEPGAKAVINDYFSCHVGVVTPLYFAITNHCSLQRIRFLVEEVGAKPVENDLLCACIKDKWEVMKYLHSINIRYTHFDDYNNHLRRYVTQENRVAFAFCYPQFWDYYPTTEATNMFMHWRAVDLARHRKKAVLQARVAMLGVKSRIGKDMIKKIVGYTKQPWYVAKEEWGTPSLKDFLIKGRYFFPLCILILVLVTIIVVLISLFFNPRDREANFMDCSRITCPSNNLGPMGPPGRMN